ncbi:unnamed protein product, partial [Porites lobata]
MPSDADLARSISELKDEFRSGLSSLKRELAQEHDAALKKLKTATASVPNFKKKGNEKQFLLNSEVLEHVRSASTALQASSPQVEKALEELKEGEKKLSYRNKLILVADSSEEGWEVVNEYQRRDLADDSDDDKRIRQAELNDVKAPSLRCLAEKLPEIVLGSRADSTTLTYLNGFKRWRAWANRFPEVAVLPATPAYVSLYLLSVLQASSSPAPVQNAFYSIRWAHDIAGFDSPTNHTLPQKVVESAKRRLLHLTSKKLPITPEILQKLFQSLDGSLVDTRFMAMALLALAGFLRFDELANLKLRDLALHDTHFELFIESSKTDQYREGAIVPIVKSGTDLCPWGNLEKYLSQAKLTLPTSSQGGDDYLFG